MNNTNKCVGFVDIMGPRHTESGIISFMTRDFYPQTTIKLDKYYTPQELKEKVANSVYLDAIIEAESSRQGIRKDKLKREVLRYLEEMGFDRKMHTIRWMGVFFLKMCFMMKIKLYVSEPVVLKLKSTLGQNPVLFLPTHRSYADFCVMTYLCYHYDIEFPVVAAGMDFYSMAVVGRRMRETGAFYIRRTIVGDRLYAATLKHYVRTLVSSHCAPVEFFLEGTRSRSNKSLPPKYGMLSMALMPYFSREVSDVTIVPINISYDRLMEHGLFAYEHIGVPKPKESTGGLLKAIRSLNDHFGNIYINLGEPISLNQFLNKQSHSDEILKPIELHELSSEQFKDVQRVAEHVITMHQDCTVATITNLVALVMTQSLMSDEPLLFDDVLKEVEWVMEVLRRLGAEVFENDVKGSVERILVVHKKMLRLDKGRLKLVAEPAGVVSSEVQKKMKGHILSAETMAIAVPIIQLQLYVNPILHYIVPPALVYLIVQRGPINIEQLTYDYKRLRKLLSHEFFHLEDTEDVKLTEAIEYCIQSRVINKSSDEYTVGDDTKLQLLLKWSLWPALCTLLHCAHVMNERQTCEHKQALKAIQQRVEASDCHPYCLSLEAISNCLQGLTVVGALYKDKTQQEQTYIVTTHVLHEHIELVRSVLPKFDTQLHRNNNCILDQRALAKI